MTILTLITCLTAFQFCDIEPPGPYRYMCAERAAEICENTDEYNILSEVKND